MPEHQIKTAAAPFDNASATVVLRTCDNVDFHVFREILLVASPVFATIFSLPSPNSDNDADSKDGVPVIPISEDQETMDYILRLCYPLPGPPKLTSVSVAEKVFEAAMKYEIQKVLGIVENEVTSLGSADPLRLYSFSCRIFLERGAQRAAELLREKYRPSDKCPGCTTYSSGKKTCRGDHPVTDGHFCTLAETFYAKCPSDLSAGCLFRLIRFICFGTASSFYKPDESDFPDVMKPKSLKKTSSHSSYPDATLLEHHPPDIILRSSDMVDFPAHKLVLRVASAYDIVDRCVAGGPLSSDGIPIVDLAESSIIVGALLERCYAGGEVSTRAVDTNKETQVWRAARKYKMRRLAEAVKSQLLSRIRTSPLKTYFTAVSCHWQIEAEEAARDIASQEICLSTSYVTEMDGMGTLDAYRKLLRFCHKVSHSQYQVLQALSPDMPKSEQGDSWYDPAFSRPSKIPVGIILRLLKDLGQSSYHSKFVRQEYDTNPMAFGRELFSRYTPVEQQLLDGLSKITLEL
ncbi:unnamed protein product [Somion occarium]|uniref:BTB domain-containing protein n=1 Tax=Somion occarium TaxID=3059160 RepID=A0ABP1CTL9_9APHY